MSAVMFESTYTVPRAGRPGRPAGTSRLPSRAPRSRSHRAAVVYRRRRLAAAAIGVLAAVAVGHAGAALGGTSLAAPGARPRVLTHVVQPGDTLWSIARSVAPNTDPRPVVDAIASSRHNAPLVPGEKITWMQP
jgi:nucleoid-associated protein YgaU